MDICYSLKHVFTSQSTDLENSYALQALLDCLIKINLAYLKQHKVSRLYQSGVTYGRTKKWYPIPELYERGEGDCKSLACALVAEYKSRGVEASPVFRFYKDPKNESLKYHIVVLLPGKNGLEHKQFEDPSLRLGMGADEVRWFYRR